MKKVLSLFIALMFVFAVTAAFAADAAKAKKATVTGPVIAIDAKAGTLTVKGPKKGDVALTANDRTKVMADKDMKTLADIKAGDKVSVEYTEADGKNTAKKIMIKGSAPAAAAAPKAAAPAKKAAGGY